MTPQEAKALFEEDLKDGKCNDTCPECNAKELAIKALEKQIAKKPKKRKDTTYSFCPCCDSGNLQNDYCTDCGQKIDWSDTE